MKEQIAMNLIVPLKCSKCDYGADFAANLDNFDKIEGCPICYCFNWYKNEPPSSHCYKCGAEMTTKGQLMIGDSLQKSLDKTKLCEFHKG